MNIRDKQRIDMKTLGSLAKRTEYEKAERNFEKLLVATNNIELINSYYDFKRTLIREIMQRLERINSKL